MNHFAFLILLTAGQISFARAEVTPITPITPVTQLTESLEIGAEDAAGPWGQTDGTGAGNEIVVAAFKASGIEAKLKILPYARCKNEVLNGKIAGCFSMAPHPEQNGKVVLAKDALYNPKATFYINRKNQFHPKNLSQIQAGAKIGTVNGYEYPDEVTHLKTRGITFESPNSESALLRLLEKNRIDYAVIMIDDLKSADLKSEDFMAKDSGTQGKVIPQFSVPSAGSYVGFSLGHPKGTFAKTKFDEGFSKIKTDGLYARIIKQWKDKLAKDKLISK